MASYVNPQMRTEFESLPIDLKNEILRRDVKINDPNDLISILHSIAGEAPPAP